MDGAVQLKAALAGAMNGQDVAAKRLDAFFTKLNVGDHGPDAWMAWLGNEPSLETPWIYDFWGQPWNTQDIVRRAMTGLYSASYAAYPGNDDVGEMSSWYIFGALGMYPELPGSDILLVGSPLFPKAVLHLPGGRPDHHRQRRGQGRALRPEPHRQWAGVEQAVAPLLRHLPWRDAGL